MPVITTPRRVAQVEEHARAHEREQMSTSVQYFLLPESAFSNISTSHDIIDFRPCAEFRLPPDGETPRKLQAHLALRVDRLPNTSAFSLHASTHTGSLPWSILSAQKSHFSTTPLVRVGYS